MDLTITNESFNKAAKKLQKTLTAENLTLSKSQEILSHCLGFRNYHAVTEYFKKRGEEKKDKPISFINNLSEDKLALLLLSYMTNKEDMWQQRAASLVYAVVPLLTYLKEEKKILLSVTTIKEFFTIKNIIDVSNQPDIPLRVSSPLKNYLLYLPGFKEGLLKQSETVTENHQYLQMQFITLFTVLEKIEKERIVLIPRKTIDYIVKYKGAFGSISSWIYFEQSNFFNDDIVKLLLSQSNSITGDLYLDDLLILSLDCIKEDSRRRLFNIVQEFVQNLSTVKNFSQKLRELSH